jgi:hypothetical protein
VRDAGGYEKTPTAFAEFWWADFFRSRIAVGPERSDGDGAVAAALKLATAKEAARYPAIEAPTKHGKALASLRGA